MMLPYDPMLSFIVVVGVFVYYGLKRAGKPKKSHNEKSIRDIYREIGEQSTEYKRYQEWFKERQ